MTGEDYPVSAINTDHSTGPTHPADHDAVGAQLTTND